MKTSRILQLIFGFIIAVILITAIFVRKEYTVESHILILRPVEQVFEYIQILENQQEYSLWNLVDPTAKRVFSGAPDGCQGHIVAWDSFDPRLGRGEEEIINLEQNKRIDIEIRFKRPLPFTDYTYMITEMTPENNTVLTWGIHGKRMYPLNIVYLYYDMEALLRLKLNRSIDKIKRNLEY